MKIEMGESLFYSWLRHVKECQVVQNNWKVSKQWNLCHEKELEEIKQKTDQYFHDKYDYDIYKKNASLSQIINQGECDAIGVSFSNDGQKTYCVDVAFHESGLNYGSRKETVMKIINKCIRTAMCVYGYMNIKDAEVIFASPKIHKAVLEDAKPCLVDAESILHDMGYDFKLRLIANEDFKSAVLDPILIASDGIADTNELFLRSYQMLKMFENNKEARKSVGNHNESDDAYKELKIGKLAQIMIKKCLIDGRVSDEEIQQMQTSDYSKKVFDLQYPVIARTDGNYDSIRYYANPFTVGNVEYVLCSQWFETTSNNDRPYLLKWINEHE